MLFEILVALEGAAESRRGKLDEEEEEVFMETALWLRV